MRLPNGQSIYQVRFRHGGRRIEKSTGCSDRSEAASEAARIYADIVSGRRTTRAIATDLTKAVADYLSDRALDVSPEWASILECHFNAHLLPFFETFEGLTLASYRDYGRARLQRVSRSSVRQELSALRGFVEWCNEREMGLPSVPRLPKHGSPGTRAKNARKRKATIIDPADAKRILDAMPEVASRTGHLVRPLFTVLWETGLRPTTVLKLETPLHYAKGQDRLFITREIDKEGFERHVPLSKAARQALDLACPSKPGRLFTAAKASLRTHLENALRDAGLTDRAISVYDFKHTRISIGANSGAPLAGIAHLVGHKHVSTTALYIQTGEGSARAALAVMGDVSAKSGDTLGDTRPKRKTRRTASTQKTERFQRCAKGGT